MRAVGYATRQIKRYNLSSPPLLPVALPPLVFDSPKAQDQTEMPSDVPAEEEVVDNAYVAKQLHNAFPDSFLSSHASLLIPKENRGSHSGSGERDVKRGVVPKPSVNSLLDIAAYKFVCDREDATAEIFETLNNGFEVHEASQRHFHSMLQYMMENPALEGTHTSYVVPYVIGCDSAIGTGMNAHDGPLVCSAFARFLVEPDGEGGFAPLPITSYRDHAFEASHLTQGGAATDRSAQSIIVLDAVHQNDKPPSPMLPEQPPLQVPRRQNPQKIKVPTFPLNAEEDNTAPDLEGESPETLTSSVNFTEDNLPESLKPAPLLYALPQETIPLGGYSNRSQSEASYAFEQLLFGTELRSSINDILRKFGNQQNDKATSNRVQSMGARPTKAEQMQPTNAGWQLKGDVPLPFKLPVLSVYDMSFHGLKEDVPTYNPPVDIFGVHTPPSASNNDSHRPIPPAYDFLKSVLEEELRLNGEEGTKALSAVISRLLAPEDGSSSNTTTRHQPLMFTIPFISATLVPADKSTYHPDEVVSQENISDKLVETVQDAHEVLNAVPSKVQALKGSLTEEFEAIWSSQRKMYPSLFETKIETKTVVTSTLRTKGQNKAGPKSTTSIVSVTELPATPQRYFINVGSVAIINRPYIDATSHETSTMDGITAAAKSVMRIVDHLYAIEEPNKNGDAVKKAIAKKPPGHSLKEWSRVAREKDTEKQLEIIREAIASRDRDTETYLNNLQSSFDQKYSQMPRSLERKGDLRTNAPFILVNGMTAPTELLAFCHSIKSGRWGETGACFPVNGGSKISFSVAAAANVAAGIRDVIMKVYDKIANPEGHSSEGDVKIKKFSNTSTKEDFLRKILEAEKDKMKKNKTPSYKVDPKRWETLMFDDS